VRKASKLFCDTADVKTIKYGKDFWAELKTTKFSIAGYQLKIKDLPLKVDYTSKTSTGEAQSWVHLSGFILL